MLPLAFGPVPSRRLGMSLGINHIPPKNCTYSCVYCQVGRTDHLTISRQVFYQVDNILNEVEAKVTSSKAKGVHIDTLTLVPDGEPSLDLNLGKIIEGLKIHNIPIAVISNGSLIHHQDVQNELMLADWVSLKVDAVEEPVWRRINRPHRHLSLPAILNASMDFKRKFKGTLATETMLAAGVNDSPEAIQKLKAYLDALQPHKTYLSLPIRPPAESWVKSPDSRRLEEILLAFSQQAPFLDLLFEAETDDFVSTGNLAEDILSITSVHPIREIPLRRMVADAKANWQVVEELVQSQQLLCVQYGNEKFFLHRFNSKQDHSY